MQNSPKTAQTEDLRVQRTKELLEKALIELTVEKGFTKVTVRDITERARVNRSTFYRHYIDKYDLLEQYATAVNALTHIDDFVAEKRGEPLDKGRSGFISLLKHVQQFADFYRVMLGQNGDPAFTERFRRNAVERFRYLLTQPDAPADPDDPPLEMRLNYVACAGVGSILWWLENDQPCTPEELAQWVSKMSSRSVGLYPNGNG